MNAKSKAQQGLQLLEDAIVELLGERDEWTTHSEIQDSLELRHDFNGNHAGYLSGAILNRLINKNKIVREGEGRGNHSKYRLS